MGLIAKMPPLSVLAAWAGVAGPSASACLGWPARRPAWAGLWPPCLGRSRFTTALPGLLARWARPSWALSGPRSFSFLFRCFAILITYCMLGNSK